MSVSALASPSSFAPGERCCFSFRAPGAAPVLAYLYVPTGLSASTRVVVVMHGTMRNAHEYIDGWTAWAEHNDHVILAPRFHRAGWPGSRSYHLGNVLRDGARTHESSWAFTTVEALHDRVRSELCLDDPSFALWGHSAGGQFVHRFLLFRPHARIRAAIAAGCGWFTVPDLGTRFPYGLRHPVLGFGEDDALRYVRTPLTIMRGTLDTVRDAHLRTSRAAEAQGRNRYERAGHAHRAARRLDPSSSWRLTDVPGVGHDWTAMAPVAQAILEER